MMLHAPPRYPLLTVSGKRQRGSSQAKSSPAMPPKNSSTWPKSVSAYLKLPLLTPLRLPFRPQSGAVDGLASEVDRVDLADIGNVVERIGVEHDEIGALAGCHHAELI